MAELDTDMLHLVAGMRKEMGRWPTEDEIMEFIFETDPEKQLTILREAKDVPSEPKDSEL